jgi:hypothetical protein
VTLVIVGSNPTSHPASRASPTNRERGMTDPMEGYKPQTDNPSNAVTQTPGIVEPQELETETETETEETETTESVPEEEAEEL